MLVTFGETALRCSPAGGERLETARRFDVQASGPESNAAVAARRLGTPVAWFSRLPDTPLGHRIASELRSYDLDIAVDWGEGRQGLTFYERGSDPRASVRVDDRLDSAVTELSMAALPLERVEGADAAYVTGATPALSTDLAGATARFLKTAADAGTTTAFSLAYRPWLWEPEEAGELLTQFFPAVDVFVATEADVATVLDRDGKPAEVAHALASTYGFEYVALVRERTGVLWHDSTVHEYPTPSVEVVDETGGEAAFAGGLLSALVDGDDPADALRTAMATRALARTIPGSVPTVSEAEVRRVAATVEKPRE
jgi:2-dehydro-3-deoxygluconokinase